MGKTSGWLHGEVQGESLKGLHGESLDWLYNTAFDKQKCITWWLSGTEDSFLVEENCD